MGCNSQPLLSLEACLLLVRASRVPPDKRNPRLRHSGVIGLNDAIWKATGTVLNELIAASSKKKKGSFIDVDNIYQGHSFCEPGWHDNSESSQTWFFTMESCDIGGMANETTIVSIDMEIPQDFGLSH